MSQKVNNAWMAFIATAFAVLIMALGALAFIGLKKARGAELKLPLEIVCGATRCDGRHKLKHYQKRWKRMCKTGARYDAMREADDLRQPNPC